MTKRRLGKGLDALLPSPLGMSSASATSRASSLSPQSSTAGTSEAAIETLHPNRSQPRRRFEDEALQELVRSIAEHGVLEPILVRERIGGGFEIVAGERRWRAAQRAGLKEVPIHVRELSDQGAFEAALVENLQREDLNPIETARAFARLAEEFGLTQEQISDRVGKDRSTVANAIRLLRLPEPILDMLEDGVLSEGHGRALLSAPEDAMMVLARTAREKNWSVRETESRSKAAKKASSAHSTAPKEKNVNMLDLERRLSHALGSTVSLSDRGGSGEIRINYASWDELDRLIVHLTGTKS
ncbi:MAG: ParB/RepB/Spo0J family partition protein [Myxococcota bacterium]